MDSGREVVVLSGVRTAIGDYGGTLKDLAPTDLAARVVREAVSRAKVAPEDVGHLVFGNVIEFGFDHKGAFLVTLIDAAGQVGNGVQLRDMKTGAVSALDSARATYRRLAWNEETTAFTVLKATDDPGYEGKWHALLGFTDLGPKPAKTVYDPKDDKDFPKDMAISPNRPAAWTDGLDAFSFGIAERKKKDEPTSPNCSGVRCRSAISGWAASPTTTLSAKLMSMNRKRRAVMPQAPLRGRSCELTCCEVTGALLPGRVGSGLRGR